MADQSLDELLARMAQTRVPRRSFLAASGLLGVSAALAVCAGTKLEGASPDAASNEARLKIYSDFKAAIGA